ncbi:nitroreductase family deazaflavin-dependent oxidoreductase [Cryptosporangium minutisporangium]|uniref:Nitroreductase family deazaflavin-dependent oxidoreductase n=1 Tax=Cryptosporangium minutisporangium TaxID=113569 RepID=A0ABP6ST56_9ACTN
MTRSDAADGEYAPSRAEKIRDQVELFEASDGAAGNRVEGAPIVVVTTLGARSGRLRKTPLIRVEHEREYALVASMSGAPVHPAWYYNLTANPLAELQDGPVKRDYRAREVHGAERAIWWRRATDVWPAFELNQRHSRRRIPVLVLSPAAH